MKPSPDLHQLIHSMSMSEKRYFKIYSSRHIIGEGNNYLRLFDAIREQEKYDEQAIKNLFKGETFIRHLPSEKHYLYSQVLDSLNSYGKERTFLARYSNTIISIELLFNRGLFTHCKKLIRKAKKEAYSLEKFSTLLMLKRWETLIFIQDEDDKNLNKSIGEELRILEVIRNQTRLMQIAFNIQVQIDKGKATPAFIRQQEVLLEKHFPTNPEITSFWAIYYYYSGIGLLSTVTNRYMQRYRCYKEIKLLMDGSPQFIRELPVIYHINMNNLVNVMFYLEKYMEAEELIRQQRRFMYTHHIDHPNLEKMLFFNTNESELYLCYKTGRYEAAAALTRKIDHEVRKTDVTFSPMLFDLLFFMAVAELMVENYKGATKWLNKILNNEHRSNIRKELQINTRLLYLVALFDSNDPLLESRLKSTKRFIMQEKQFHTQLKILELIRMLSGSMSGKKKKDAVGKSLAMIRKDSRKAIEKSLNKQFDFAEWLERTAARLQS